MPVTTRFMNRGQDQTLESFPVNACCVPCLSHAHSEPILFPRIHADCLQIRTSLVSIIQTLIGVSSHHLGHHTTNLFAEGASGTYVACWKGADDFSRRFRVSPFLRTDRNCNIQILAVSFLLLRLHSLFFFFASKSQWYGCDQERRIV